MMLYEVVGQQAEPHRLGEVTERTALSDFDYFCPEGLLTLGKGFTS